jgi:hypothetical protein
MQIFHLQFGTCGITARCQIIVNCPMVPTHYGASRPYPRLSRLSSLPPSRPPSRPYRREAKYRKLRIMPYRRSQTYCCHRTYHEPILCTLVSFVTYSRGPLEHTNRYCFCYHHPGMTEHKEQGRGLAEFNFDTAMVVLQEVSSMSSRKEVARGGYGSGCGRCMHLLIVVSMVNRFKGLLFTFLTPSRG